MCENEASVVALPFLRSLSRFDWLLMLAAFVLFAFGIASITSVELSRGAEEFVFVRKQLIALGLGLVLLLAAAVANYQVFRSYGRLLYILAVILLLLVLVFGETFNGTTGWFVIGGFSFQPIELMKLALAIELARYFSDQARERFGWRELIESGLRALLPMLLVLLQPDWGGAAILFGIWAVTVFFAGIRGLHVAVLGVVMSLALMAGLVYIAGPAPWRHFQDNERLVRITTFLNPTADPLGEGYNINQAKIAIGAGGVFGRGLGAGSQSQLRFLPESQTDFVFAVIAEELGFVGVLIVLLAFGLLFYRMFALVRITRDAFAAYLVLAIFATVFVQTVIHIGVNLAVMPATGVTLPFVSYGGSSLLLMLVMLGVVESVASRVTPVDRLAAAK